MSARTALVLSQDPYLTFLLERHPEGLEVTVADDQMRGSAIVSAGADVVVCEHDDPRRPELVAAIGPRLVTVASHDDRSERGARVIRRPLSAEEVLRAIDEVDRRTPTIREDPMGALDRAYPLLISAAGAFATALFVLRGDRVGAAAPGIVLVVYGLVRARLRTGSLWILDTFVAVGLTLVYDGARGPFVLFGLVVAAGLGLRRRPLLALPLALAIGAANVLGAVLAQPDSPLDATVAIQSVLLVTLVSALAALGTSYARTFEDRDTDRLGHVLHELWELARSNPQSLQLTSVARRALDGVCDAAAIDRGVLLMVQEDGEFRVAAARNTLVEVGTRIDQPPKDRLPGRGLLAVEPVDLPLQLVALAAGKEACTVVSVRRFGGVRGLVVLGGSVARYRRGDVLRAAAQGGTAIANARLFARLQTDTADEQRRRIAGDLHDSTAQVLTHLRLELELLARSGSASRDELERLARVSDRAQQGLREVIDGLRASLHEDGLPGTLRSYVADLQSQGAPSLVFRSTTRQHLGAEADHEMFRIAQEAISNAVRHAGASVIEVTLDQVEDALRLTVADDGIGLGPDTNTSRGLGLEQMRERAQRLGARLVVRSTHPGTEVVLTAPFERPHPADEASERTQRV